MSEADDWETAEVQLRNVTLEHKSIKAPVIIAPTLDQSYIPTIPSRDVPIDDALLTACENPREKMVVYQLEDTILKFVEASNERFLDLPSGMNSFRRLVAHRLADRFSLLKEQIAIEGNDKIIRLTKSSATCIPRPLIIDYRGTSSPIGIISSKTPSTNTNANSTDKNQGMESPTVDTPNSEPKKVLLMKRKQVDNNSSSGKSSTNKPQITAEDRERAYQEARARIFGETCAESTSATPEVTSSSSSPAPTATTESGNGVKFTNASVDISESPLNDETNQMKRSTSGGQLASNNSNNNLNMLSSSGKIRAQLRSTEAERNDPDFVRRSNKVPGNMSGQSSPYVRNAGYSGTYANNGNYYAAINTGYSEPSSFAGLNPNANTWQQSYVPANTSQKAYNYNSTDYVPPPPSLVTPTNPGYDSSAAQYYHSPYPNYPQSQQYGYYAQNPQGYEANMYSRNNNNPPAPVMSTPNNATNGNVGKRSPPPNASQSDFPPLR